MKQILQKKIIQINNQIEQFAQSWTGLSLQQLQASIDPEQLKKILEPGLDLINRGGKRWRPLLMLLCCEMAGGGEKALPFTPLVEIAHNGTLIADDIEDDSRQRRGGPAIHIKYGLDLALNTGNFMCFLPSLIIEQQTLEASRKLLVYKYFLEDLRNLHIGQGLDIQWHNEHSYLPGQEDYLLMCSLKTGTLARMAARLGVLIGGGGETLATSTGKVCEKFGVGFQIIDDVKNLTTGNPGKKQGDDIIEGKKSLPIILLAENDQQALQRILTIFRQVKTGNTERCIEEALTILTASGCIEKARDLATQLIETACREICRLFPDSHARALLLELFAGLG